MMKQTAITLQSSRPSKEDIIREIKRLAKDNDGHPPGSNKFRNETGISEAQWIGVYWARWGDALVEAGFAPNQFQVPTDEGVLLRKLALAVRHFGRIPTRAELQMYRRNEDKELPDAVRIYRRFRTKDHLLERLAEYIDGLSEFSDVAAIITDGVPAERHEEKSSLTNGYVYLIKSGAHYKIGRSDNLERRVKEISIALPEGLTLIHVIRTDDPAGIESYWHSRFVDRRAKGEWFKLSLSDVKAFKRRKFM
jgi:hypothetical protein